MERQQPGHACSRSARNLLRPRFWRMLRDMLRFNALATRMASATTTPALEQPLGAFLDEHRFGREFRDWYLLPMIGCIWSMPDRRRCCASRSAR